MASRAKRRRKKLLKAKKSECEAESPCAESDAHSSDVEVITLPQSVIAQVDDVVESVSSRLKEWSVLFVFFIFLLYAIILLFVFSGKLDWSWDLSAVSGLLILFLVGGVGILQAIGAYRKSLNQKVVVDSSGVFFRCGDECSEVRWSDVNKTARIHDVDLCDSSTYNSLISYLVLGESRIRFNLSDLKKTPMGYLNNWELRRHILLMIAIKCPGLSFNREIFTRAGINPYSWTKERSSCVIFYSAISMVPIGIMAVIFFLGLREAKWILFVVVFGFFAGGLLFTLMAKWFSLFSVVPIRFVVGGPIPENVHAVEKPLCDLSLTSGNDLISLIQVYGKQGQGPSAAFAVLPHLS